MLLDYRKLRMLLLGGALLLSSGACVKEESHGDEVSRAGKEIVFAASTGYANGDGSRTEFSGIQVAGAPVSGVTPTYERIDWMSGDPMTILYVNGSTSPVSADYQVTSVDTPGQGDRESTASVEPSGATGLEWGSGSGHVFCAVYPSVGYNETATSLTRDGQGRFIAGGSIPAQQTVSLRTVNGVSKYLPDMNYGLMVAYRSIAGGGTESVSLAFKPAFTALEFGFKFGNTDPSYKIRQFKIHAGSGSLTGPYTVQVSADGNETAWNNLQAGNGAGNLITVNFDMDGDGVPEDVSLESANEISFTVFAVPSALSQITLQMVYANGTTKELPLKSGNSWESFQAGCKYHITNYKVPVVDGGWSYMVEEIADYFCTGHDEVTGIAKEVRSYKYSALHPETKVDVPWKLQYSTDGTSWSDFNASSGTFGSTDFRLTARTDKSLTFKINGTSSYTEETNTIRNQDKADMAARTPFTASGTYFDLSTHPSFGILGASAPDATARNTANCYIVSRPGDYEFPCVYGNAITNGETNYASFAPGHTNSAVKSIESNVNDTDVYVHWAKNFRNANNADITDPWIVTDLSATNLSADILQGSDIIGSASVVDGSGGKYIRFSVTSANIKPGNVIIALKGNFGSRTNTIMWSWHIWVTNKDLTPVTIGGKRMMDWNLGWMDASGVKRRTYSDRSLQFRVVQTDAQGNELAVGDSETFTISQTGDVVNSGLNYGSNPYYQWGRKDPLASNATVSVLTYRPYSINTVSDSWDVYAGACEGLYPTIYTQGYHTDANYGFGIRTPLNAVSNSYTTGWVGGPVVPNGVWNATYLCNGITYYEEVAAGLEAYWIYTYVPNTLGITAFSHSGWLGGDSAPLIKSLATKRKTASAICYNLWNAYAWCDADFRNENQVFKTIYDPCPPGFTVPARGTFDNVGNLSPRMVGNQADGVLFSGHFFPFTGIRDWQATVTQGTEYDVYHWSHPITLNQNTGVGGAGFLWTAQHREIRISPIPGNINRDNHYVNFESARMMSFTSESFNLPGGNNGFFTAGSAASIRPMVDPRYTAKVTGLDSDLEDMENGGNLPAN